MSPFPAERLAVVAIGRNEGDRLRACLDSLKGRVARIVYVDSGSTDGSVALARGRGVDLVELDMSRPFTAARGRNAGVGALRAMGPLPEMIQFIDGDCRVQPGWLETAVQMLETRPDLGIVTGWRAEIAPEASIYNALCHTEWRGPVGEILTCGGDMMVRSRAFEEARGFDDRVIAAEDDEFCIRLRAAGWKIWRLPQEMTAHDAAITRFGQWWKRAERAGHGYAQVGAMHPGYFRTHRRRVWIKALVLPLGLLAGMGLAGMASGLMALAGGLGALAILGFYLRSFLVTAARLIRDGMSPSLARKQSGLMLLSVFPSLVGLIRYHVRQMRGSAFRLIEYK